MNKFAPLLLALAFMAPVRADFKAGLDAYQRGDFAGALKEWQPIAEKGDANAQYNVGLLYARGEGVPKDYSKAAEWYKKAADAGVVAAQYNLGVMYANGQGVTANPAEAAKWFQKAAEAGVVDAQNNLGRIYSEEGAFKNYGEAEKWYRQAAEKGVGSAAFSLGVMYDIGQGVQKNYDEALKWYQKAADLGYASAYTNIGILYYNAQGVKRDLVQSYAWFARAEKAGDPRASELLRTTASRMQPKEIAKAKEVVDTWRPSGKAAPQVEEAKLFKHPEPQGSASRSAESAPAPAASPAAPASTAVAEASRPTGAPASAAPSTAEPARAPAAPATAPGSTAVAEAGTPTGLPASPAPSSAAPATAEPGHAPAAPASVQPAAAPAPPKPVKAAQNVWTGVERVVAIGDVHGDFEQFFMTLESAGLVDGNAHWTGGKTHLVQTGDIVDRGPDSRRIMDLLMKLQDEAKAAGGYVHCLIGNHEAMDVYGDLRYVSPGEFASYMSDSSAGRQFSYVQSVRLAEPARPGAPGAAPAPMFPGFAEHRAAFGPNGVYGQWIRSHNAAIKIDRTLFVHAGLGPKYASWSLDRIDDEVRAELDDMTRLHGGIVTDEQGPLWFNGLAKGDEKSERPLVDAILQNFDVDQIVIGHTYARAAITPRFDDKVILIDIGLSRIYDNIGKLGCLLIENGKPYALHRGQKLELPTDEGPDMLRYLQQAAALDPQPSPLLDRIRELQQKQQTLSR